MTVRKFPKKVTVREIVSYFHLTQITGNDDSLNRWVVVPDVNRPGFELAGFYKMTEPRRVVIIGNKEIGFINEMMSEQEQRERFLKITDAFTPMIIVTRNLAIPPILKEVAQSENFPIFSSPLESYQLIVDLITYLDEKLAPEDVISGVLMSVYGKGVLITGESGMGKSEVALELIRDHQVLIADDRVDVQRVHNTIFGYVPELLKGFLEIRGIGIIDVQKMFGASCVDDRYKVDCVIELVKYSSDGNYERIGDTETKTTSILGVEIPTIVLPVSEGRSMGVIVESAVTNLRLIEGGYNSGSEFKKRFREVQSKQIAEDKEKE